MKNYLLMLMCLGFNLTNRAQYNYPSTKTVDSSDTYWGVTYKDPYRWLENVKSAEAEKWYKQQSEFSDSILDNISGRDELIKEYKRLKALESAFIGDRTYEGGRLFYRKSMPNEKVSKIYYREGMNGEEILLFDPLSYIEGRSFSVEGYLPSHDGKKLIFWYSEGGAEVSTIKIMNVDTKTFLPETIFPSWFGAISWTFDNKAFTYFSQKIADNTNPEFELNTKTKLHVLGDDTMIDIDFFSNESYPDLNIQSNELPFAGVDINSPKYVFADLSNVSNEFFTYYAPIDQFNNKLQWKILCKRTDGLVRGKVVFGNDVYAISNKNAKNYKLLHTTLLNPDWQNADVIVEENKAETLENIVGTKDFIILVYNKNGINSRLVKYDKKKRTSSEIRMPLQGSVYVVSIDTKTNNCFVKIGSWTKPKIEFMLNAETGVFEESTFNKAPVYPKEYSDLIAEEVEVKGHDGAMIPLSIIHKKGLKKDGKNSCLMDGYGSYGISLTPYYDFKLLALAVKGAVIAIPHVRGGSEKGEEWYKEGHQVTKPNTWKDFNSCAEFLINNGYTSSASLAGTGTSAGGILISRAITERPDLYAAAICNVGCANAMRMEFAPNGPVNIPEFGSVKDSIQCKALYEMDGVKHVKKGEKYPAVMCVGGWNDPRVIVWEPGKFAAALQNASSSNKPIIMKVNYDNGHFTEDKDVTFKNFANQFAFVMWQCGHPNFQMKNK